MRRTVAVILLGLILIVAVTVEGVAAGKMKGRVIDRVTEDPLVGASVIVLGSKYGAVADEQGEFSIINLPAGVYALKASYIGYAAVTIANIRILNDLTTDAVFALPSEGVNIQAITVVAERPLVNKSATNAVRIATADQILALPVRSVDEILSLMPGVNYQDGNIYIRGGRVDEAGYYLEGVSVTDPQTGGRGVSIASQALEEISVQSAGYEAEYGRANAGIVQHQLRTGGSEFKASVEFVTDNITFASKKSWAEGKRRLGTTWYGYSDFNAVISTPVLSEKVKLFGLFNHNYMADKHPQPYPGSTIGSVIDPGTGDSVNFNYPAGIRLAFSEETYNGTGTLSLDFHPLLLRFSGSYTTNVSLEGRSVWPGDDRSRVPEKTDLDGFRSLKATYFFTPKIFGEISGGWFGYSSKTYDPILRDNFWGYGDSVANAEAGVTWYRLPGDPNTGRYMPPYYRIVYGYYFLAPTQPWSSYIQLRRSNISLNAALSAILGDYHTVKFGGDFQRYTIRTYQIGNPRVLARIVAQNAALADGDPSKLTLAQIMIWDFYVNNYGYDVFGNLYEGDDFQGPRHPVFASGYIQDRMEFNDLVLNIGLRYDYINTAAYVPVDPSHPDLTRDPYTNAIKPDGLRKSTPFHSVTPRLGIAYPVSDLTVFHIQYSKLVQQSGLRDINVGLYSGAIFTNSPMPIGFDLRPERTTQYEIGFTQQIGDFASVDVTGYYKDIKDQIMMRVIETDRTSQYTAYGAYANGDFATTKGIELMFAMRRYKRLMVNGSLSLQDARGSGSFPNSNWGIIGAGTDTAITPYYISPLSYMNAVRGNFAVDYRFAKDDGGPILSELGASLLFTFNSGHPYTRSSANSDEFYARDRIPIEALNSSTTPWVFQFDLRLDKTIRFTDHLAWTISLYVINLFDNRNVLNVWSRTGSADDDGYLSNPDLSAALIQKYGSQYADVYRLVNLSFLRPSGYFNEPYLFGPPRQIRLGVRLEY